MSYTVTEKMNGSQISIQIQEGQEPKYYTKNASLTFQDQEKIGNLPWALKERPIKRSRKITRALGIQSRNSSQS